LKRLSENLAMPLVLVLVLEKPITRTKDENEEDSLSVFIRG
jgi:hypothetical protein